MFSLIRVWINSWVNNRKAGDLRRHRAHYDVTVMSLNPSEPPGWPGHVHNYYYYHSGIFMGCFQVTGDVQHCHFAVTWHTGDRSGPWFNIKMSSYQYTKPHCGDKTILRPSYLNNGISYTGKMTSLYWIGALDAILSGTWISYWSHHRERTRYELSYRGNLLQSVEIQIIPTENSIQSPQSNLPKISVSAGSWYVRAK